MSIRKDLGRLPDVVARISGRKLVCLCDRVRWGSNDQVIRQAAKLKCHYAARRVFRGREVSARDAVRRLLFFSTNRRVSPRSRRNEFFI